jgi:hypothetical protein
MKVMMINGAAARKTRGAVRASKLDGLKGTWFADFIRASGHSHRAQRPDT